MTLACLPNIGTTPSKFQCGFSFGRPAIFWATERHVFLIDSQFNLERVLSFKGALKSIQITSIAFSDKAQKLAVIFGSSLLVYKLYLDDQTESIRKLELILEHEDSSFTDAAVAWDPSFSDRIFTATTHLSIWNVYENDGSARLILSRRFSLPVHSITQISVSPDGAYIAVVSPNVLPIVRIFQIRMAAISGIEMPVDSCPLKYHVCVLDSPAERVSWRIRKFPTSNSNPIFSNEGGTTGGNCLLVSSILGTQYLLAEMPRYGRNGWIDRFVIKYMHQSTDLRGALFWWQLDCDPISLFFSSVCERHDPHIWDLSHFPGTAHDMATVSSSISILGLGKKMPWASHTNVSLLSEESSQVLISDSYSSTPSMMVLRRIHKKDDMGSKDRFEMTGSFRAPGALRPSRLVHHKNGNLVCLIDGIGNCILCEVRNGRLIHSLASKHLWEEAIPGKLDLPGACVSCNDSFCVLSGGILRVIRPGLEISEAVKRVMLRNAGILFSVSDGSIIENGRISSTGVFIFGEKAVIIEDQSPLRIKFVSFSPELPSKHCTILINRELNGSETAIMCGINDNFRTFARLLDGPFTQLSPFASFFPEAPIPLEHVKSDISVIGISSFGDVALWVSGFDPKHDQCIGRLIVSYLSPISEVGLYHHSVIHSNGVAPVAGCWAVLDSMRYLYLAYKDRVSLYTPHLVFGGRIEWTLRSSYSWPVERFPEISDNSTVNLSVDSRGFIWLIVDSITYWIEPLNAGDIKYSESNICPDLQSHIHLYTEINALAIGVQNIKENHSSDHIAVIDDNFSGLTKDLESETINDEPDRHDVTVSPIPFNPGTASSSAVEFSFFDINPESIVANLNSLKEDGVQSQIHADHHDTESCSAAFDSSKGITASISKEISNLSSHVKNDADDLDIAASMYLALSKMKGWSNPSLRIYEGFEFLSARMSDAQNILIDLTISKSNCLESNEKFLSSGLGFWVRDTLKLRSLMEASAKADFSKSHDPRNCTLFFILLGRLKGLSMLWKETAPRIAAFLASNPQDNDFKVISNKNAFAALSKQDHVLAIIFFLLASRFNDAIVVSLDKLNSPHLAFLIIRCLICSIQDFPELAAEKVIQDREQNLPICIRVLFKKLFHEDLDFAEIYDELENSSNCSMSAIPSNSQTELDHNSAYPVLDQSHESLICIPLAFSSLRNIQLPREKVINVIQELCRNHCYSVALNVAQRNIEIVHPALILILKQYQLLLSKSM